jgi:predicted transcriptional regulator
VLAVAVPEVGSLVPSLVAAPMIVAGASPGSASLENDTRRRVYERVCSHPGSSIARVAEASDVSHSTATYHLETLEDAGLVVSITDGNKRRFFANAGAFSERERRTLAVLENATTLELVAALGRRQPTYRSRLAEAIDVAPPTVNWHLERLEACRAVDERPDGQLEVADDFPDVVEALVGKLEDVARDLSGLRDLLAAVDA